MSKKIPAMFSFFLILVIAVTQAGTIMISTLALEDSNFDEENIVIPAWIKQSAQWWSDGQISDKEFVESIEFLITEKLIQSPRIAIYDDSHGKELQCDENKITAAPNEKEPIALDKPPYDPQINPKNFVSKIDNKFLTFTPGTTFVYQVQTKEGLERIEVSVLDEKQMVMGVENTVVWDRVWLDGELIEDTKDWYAQDTQGNVWYFGEESKEYALGELVSHHGSWKAGIDGAKPGIIMKASPQIGDVYRQEYYEGVAEDMGEVVSLYETVVVPHDRLYNCLKTKDWNPLEGNTVEYKYYCPEIGGVALEEVPEDNERMELIAVGSDSLMTNITEKEAKQIALNEVPGIVTDIVKEGFRGKLAYAVEIMSDNGIEIDVFVDIKTGKVLGKET